MPFFLEIGENDFPNLRNQHVAMLKTLEAEAGRVEGMERLGHNHFEIRLDHGNMGNPWSRRIAGPPLLVWVFVTIFVGLAIIVE